MARCGVDSVRIIDAAVADSGVEACQTQRHKRGAEPALSHVVKAVGFVTGDARSSIGARLAVAHQCRACMARAICLKILLIRAVRAVSHIAS